jgi:hypothetical protein
MDIQQKLDEILADNPDLQKYIAAWYYVPDGATPPRDVSHLIRVTSTTTAARHASIGIVATPAAGAILEAILALIATQPIPPEPKG